MPQELQSWVMFVSLSSFTNILISEHSSRQQVFIAVCLQFTIMNCLPNGDTNDSQLP